MSSAVAEPVVTTPANAEADAAAKAAAVEAQKAEDDKKAKEAADAAAAAAAAATPAVETPPSDAVRATEGAKFMAAFGEVDGAKYFAKGLSFADAQMAHMSTLSHRLEAAELKLSQIGSSGEPGPVSSTGGTEKKKPKPYAIPDPVAK